jgi:hypothetical protein
MMSLTIDEPIKDPGRLNLKLRYEKMDELAVDSR